MRAAAFLIALLPAPALADASPENVATLDACMQAPTGAWPSRACIGVVSDPCLNMPTGESTAGMVHCLFEEADAWDVLLNREYQSARTAFKRSDALSAPEWAIRAQTLRDAQRAWIAFRDANCESSYAVWGNGSIRRIAWAQCQMQMAAERTLELRALYQIEN